jgi:eukaryotic-like serine/threonine-protein kinase
MGESAADLENEAAAPAATDSTDVDEVLGRYRLRRELATGGMATVFLAVPKHGASRPEEVVALKRIHPHLAQQRSFVEMFMDEARLTSKIVHPNVARVLDWGRAGNSFFLAMEYLRGVPLARVMKALRGLSERDAVVVPVLAARLCSDAARGLHAAHELRDADGVLLEVVHRDVSPHNLFVSYEGVLSVVDFGIARARGRLHHTETGTVKGKFAYMAPEQMAGHPVDRRADVWSLGVVLWELLAGGPLFRRRNESEIVIAVTRGDIPKIPGIDPRLAAIVNKALTRDPSRRFATAAELAEALDAWRLAQPGPSDANEVAAWMHSLFPGGAASAKALADRAAAVPPYLLTVKRDRGEESSMVRRRERKTSFQTAAALGLALAMLLASAGLAAWHWTRSHPTEAAAILER